MVPNADVVMLCFDIRGQGSSAVCLPPCDTLGFLLLLISSKESLYHPANMGHGFLVKRGTFSLDLITNSSN